MTTEQIQPWQEGVPVDKLEELAKTFAEVKIYVKRRNQWKKVAAVANISGQTVSTLELIDFAEWIAPRVGGGDYEVECHNPLGTAPRILLRFKCSVEGPVTAPDPRMAGVPATMPLPPISGPPLPFQTQPAMNASSPWVQGLSPQDQMSYQRSLIAMQPPQPVVVQQPSMQAESSTNAALYRQLGEVQSMLRAEQQLTASLRERLETEKQNSRDKFETEKAARVALEADLRRQHDRDLAQLRLEFETKLETRRREHDQDRKEWEAKQQRIEDDRRKTENDGLRREMELIKSSKTDSSEDKMMIMHRSAAESQQNFLNMMLGLLSKPQTNGAEAIMPVIMKMMDARAPEAQAALLGQMMENQVTAIGAMSAMLREQAGPEPSPWIQMGMQALEGMKGIAASVMRDGAQNRLAQQNVVQAMAPQLAPGMPQQQPQQQVVQQPQQQPGPSMFSAQPFDMPATPTNGHGQHVEEAPPLPPMELSPEMARRVTVESEVDHMLTLLPKEFQSPEWRHILVELHLESEDAAELIARHIEWHFLFKRPLPAALKDFLANPQGALEGLTQWLPINTSNPEYVKNVIATIVEAFTPDAEEEAEATAQAAEA
jgi:hypothetical protein